MSDFTFQMLLQSQYSGKDNSINKLHIEHLIDDEWKQLELNTYTPGFDIFMHSIIICQHMSFSMNATEYGLKLASCEGLITIIADQHRSIETLNVDFKGQLKEGEANKDIIDSIAARMALCPVSINLKDIPQYKTTVTFI